MRAEEILREMGIVPNEVMDIQGDQLVPTDWNHTTIKYHSVCSECSYKWTQDLADSGDLCNMCPSCGFAEITITRID